MSDEPETPIGKIHRQIAETEAKLDALKLKLAKAEAKGTGKRVVVDGTGIEQLWKEALNRNRTRSSKQQCRTEWNRIPVAERPSIDEALAALKVWKKTEEWTRDACMYAPGLHLFIKRRLWEDVPKIGSPMDRYKQPEPKPLPVADPEDTVLSREERRALLGIKKP